MLKQCPSCGRFFDHDENDLCERCQESELKVHFSEESRKCDCGKMFTPINEHDSMCPACKRTVYESMNEDEREKVYKQVRDYLYANPLTPKVKVSERFGVPMKYIDEWVGNGQIQQIGEVDLKEIKDNTCSVCGAKTSQGKLCKACEKKIGEKMESYYNTKKSSTKK